MSKNQAYLNRLRRRMHLGAAQLLLGLGLAVYGYAMRFAHPDGGEQFHFAWNMFSALSAVVIAANGAQQFYQNRKILRGPEFYQERGRVEDEDERGRLVEQLAWRAAGRSFSALLIVAMMVALAAEQLAVFWTCYVSNIMLTGGRQLCQRWYEKRL